MASSAADHAGNRVGLAKRDIEAALKAGDADLALTEATRALRSLWAHMAKQRPGPSGRRPGDAAIAAAQLAGSLIATAARLHNLKPRRPDGCPQVPGPDDLLAAYRDAVEGAEGGSR